MPEGIPYASSNVIAGAGLELNYVGNYVYAYSGTIQATQSEDTVLEFTTGNKLIVGSLTCSGGIENNGGGVSAGTLSAFTLSLNGIEIARVKTSTSGTSPDNPSLENFPIMIPPYTLVKVTVFSTSTDGKTSTLIIGKVQ